MAAEERRSSITFGIRELIGTLSLLRNFSQAGTAVTTAGNIYQSVANNTVLWWGMYDELAPSEDGHYVRSSPTSSYTPLIQHAQQLSCDSGISSNQNR